MILEVDVGNTRLKWRLLDEAGYCSNSGSCGHDVSFLDDLQAESVQIKVFRIACVAQDKIKRVICDAVLERWAVQANVAETLKEHAGLKIAYDDPLRLGVDRWLAMLAAYRDASNAVCVVDCGSAITVDLVDKTGQHEGGYIVPGVAMQKGALLSETGRIRLEESVEGCHKSWGHSTEEAVNFGVLRQVSSFINAIVHELVTDREPPAFYICGGDAEMLLPMLGHQDIFNYSPDLVIDGLAIALD